MEKIAIIGTGAIAEVFAKRLKELKIQSYCFSWEKASDISKYVDIFYPISILEKERILEKCRELKINGVLGTTELTIEVAAYIAEKLNLNGNSPHKVALELTNKYLNREKIKNIKELKQPNYFVINSYEELNKLKIKFPIILKPLAEGGKRGITVIKSLEELREGYTYTENFCKNIKSKILVEEYLSEGKEYSVESLTYKGETFIIQITEKESSGAPYCVELGHHQPAILLDSIKLKINKGISKALSSLGIVNGPCHTEIKIIDNEIYVIEFNARPGGDKISYPLTELSTGYPYITGIIEIALGKFNKDILKELKKNFAGILFLTKQTEYLKEIFYNCEKYEWFYKKNIVSEELKELRNNDADHLNYFIYFSTKKRPDFRIKEEKNNE